MSEKNYVTIADGERLNIEPYFQQCFEHESSQPKTMPEYTLVKAFIKLSDYDRQVTMEVLKMLSQFTFATRKQLERLLTAKGLDPSGLEGDIELMMENRQMNCFYLSREAPVEYDPPEDALLIYCMDFGALALLNHFSNSDSVTWFTTDAVRGSELVQKYLSTVEFYLALAEVQGPALRYFKPTFDVAFGHREIRFSAAFEITDGNGVGHAFLLESVRGFDLPLNWRDKLDKKLVHFAVQPRNWGRYFLEEPVFLLLVEDEKDALEAAELFYRRTEKNNFRLITDEQVRQGLAKARFLKYIPYQPAPIAGEVTEEVKAKADLDAMSHAGTLQPVRASLLSGA